MIEIEIKGKQHSLPEGWEELSEEQLEKVAPFLYPLDGDQARSKVNILQVLLPISTRTFSKISFTQLWELGNCLSWMFTSPLFIPPVKFFVFQGREYLLPKAKLVNLSGIEFAYADARLQAFLAPKNSNPKPLNELVAALCRPAKKDLDLFDPEYDGDPREKFNSEVSGLRAKSLDELDFHLKILVLNFFIGCKKWIFNRFQFQQGAPEGGLNLGVTGMLMDLSKSGVFGDFEKTCYTPLHTILVYLKKAEYEYLQSKLKSKTNVN